MNYYGYIYRVDCLENGTFYYGQHRGDFDPTYLGSGIRVRRSVDKYGEDSHTVVPVMFCKTKKEINKQEIKIITSAKLEYGKKCMNIARGGEGSCPVPGTAEYEKYIKIWSERSKLDNVVSHLGGVRRGKDHPLYGTKRTDECKRKISKTKTGKTYEDLYGDKADERRKHQSDKLKEGYRNGRRKKVAKEQANKMIKWQKENKNQWLNVVRAEEYRNKARDRRYKVLNKMWEDKCKEFLPKMRIDIDYTVNSFSKEMCCSFGLAKNVLNLLNKKGCVNIINKKYFRRV
jgi:ribosomal protein S25